MTAIQSYHQQLVKTLDEAFECQSEALEAAAEYLSQTLHSGGMIYTFGTGHGHLLALEGFYRAGGLARVCPVLDEKLMLHISAASSTMEERDVRWVDTLLARFPMKKGDSLIIFSNSGRNAVPVELALSARERGVRVIAVTSLKHTLSVTSRAPSGRRLCEVADLVLDNCGVPGDAALSFADGASVGPTSTAVGAALLQAVICRVKERSLEQGFDAEFFMSSNVDGGDAFNEELIRRYRDQIPGLA